jgi:hypothetical protein
MKKDAEKVIKTPENVVKDKATKKDKAPKKIEQTPSEFKAEIIGDINKVIEKVSLLSTMPKVQSPLRLRKANQQLRFILRKLITK